MGALFLFILISVLIISALLFFNKGEKAQEIKSTLKDIYENIKQLLSNLKKLLLILKDLIQEKLDTEPIQLADKPSSDESPKSDSSNDSSAISANKLEHPTEDSNPDESQSKPEVIKDQEIDSPIELETPSNNSVPESNQSQPDVLKDQKIDSSSESDYSTQDLASKKMDSTFIPKTGNEIISSEEESPDENSNNDYLDKKN